MVLKNTIYIRLGKFIFVIISENVRFLDSMSNWFFATNGKTEPDVFIRVFFPSHDTLMLSKTDMSPFSINPIDGGYRLETNHCDLLFQDDEIISAPNRFVRVLVSLVPYLERLDSKIPKQNHIFLHAAGIIAGDGAFVFGGPSGSGKSTICAYSRRFNPINDELILVSRNHDVFHLYNTPVQAKVYNDPGISPPVRAFFIPRQDNQDYLLRLEGARAIEALMETIIFDDIFGLLTPFEFQGERFSRACAIAEKAPVYELHFQKSEAFWDAILKEFPI